MMHSRNPVARVDLLEDEQPKSSRLDELDTLLDGVFSTVSGIYQFTSRLEAESDRLFTHYDTPRTEIQTPPQSNESPWLNTLSYAAYVAADTLYHQKVYVEQTRPLIAKLQNSINHVTRSEQSKEHAHRVGSLFDSLNSLHDGRLKVNVKSDTQYSSVLSAMTVIGLLHHYDILDQVITPLRKHMDLGEVHHREALQCAYFHISAAFFRACHEEQHENAPFAWSFPLVMQRTQDHIISPSYFAKSRENVKMLEMVSGLSEYLIGKGGEFKSLETDSGVPF